MVLTLFNNKNNILFKDKQFLFPTTIFLFLDASTHLYMRVCPSVVRRSIGNVFLVANKRRYNPLCLSVRPSVCLSVCPSQLAKMTKKVI